MLGLQACRSPIGFNDSLLAQDGGGALRAEKHGAFNRLSTGIFANCHKIPTLCSDYPGRKSCTAVVKTTKIVYSAKGFLLEGCESLFCF